jgi:hypothetical protein
VGQKKSGRVCSFKADTYKTIKKIRAGLKKTLDRIGIYIIIESFLIRNDSNQVDDRVKRGVIRAVWAMAGGRGQRAKGRGVHDRLNSRG